jgi:hypothetical protein
VLQRLQFKGKTSKTKFKSSEKAPPLQKPQEWGTQIPNQLQRPNFQVNFKDPTSETTGDKD